MRWPAEMVCGLKGMDNLWGGGRDCSYSYKPCYKISSGMACGKGLWAWKD